MSIGAEKRTELDSRPRKIHVELKHEKNTRDRLKRAHRF